MPIPERIAQTPSKWFLPGPMPPAHNPTLPTLVGMYLSTRFEARSLGSGILPFSKPVTPSSAGPHTPVYPSSYSADSSLISANVTRGVSFPAVRAAVR